MIGVEAAVITGVCALLAALIEWRGRRQDNDHAEVVRELRGVRADVRDVKGDARHISGDVRDLRDADRAHTRRLDGLAGAVNRHGERLDGLEVEIRCPRGAPRDSS